MPRGSISSAFLSHILSFRHLKDICLLRLLPGSIQRHRPLIWQSREKHRFLGYWPSGRSGIATQRHRSLRLLTSRANRPISSIVFLYKLAMPNVLSATAYDLLHRLRLLTKSIVLLVKKNRQKNILLAFDSTCRYQQRLTDLSRWVFLYLIVIAAPNEHCFSGIASYKKIHNAGSLHSLFSW